MVSGSRDWKDIHTIRMRLLRLPPTDEIMHGDAPGADTIAKWLAEDFGFSVTPFPPKKTLPSPQRFHERNDRMLDQADLVIAFHDGSSRGTASVIKKARKRGIPIEVISPSEPAPPQAPPPSGEGPSVFLPSS